MLTGHECSSSSKEHRANACHCLVFPVVGATAGCEKSRASINMVGDRLLALSGTPRLPLLPHSIESAAISARS